MGYMINHPRLLCVACAVAMWGIALLGVGIRAFFRVPETQDKDSLNLVVSATLTLLGLIIGFTFSMATTRYDQRRLFEEEEANAIGTEHVRVDLLPAAQRPAVKDLLRQYLEARIKFYQADYDDSIGRIDDKTAALQTRLWNAIQPQADAAPNPITALVASGMNDVLNRQGYTQFAWWNRIPVSAWVLMIIIALLANMLIGYGTRRSRSGTLLLLVLPLLIAVSFFLIADIDSPRGGIIRIPPLDLQSLAASLQTPTNDVPHQQ